MNGSQMAVFLLVICILCNGAMVAVRYYVLLILCLPVLFYGRLQACLLNYISLSKSVEETSSSLWQDNI